MRLCHKAMEVRRLQAAEGRRGAPSLPFSCLGLRARPASPVVWPCCYRLARPRTPLTFVPGFLSPVGCREQIANAQS